VTKQISELKIKHAARILKRGGVVVFPTETAYGLAADATNPIGTKRICEIKGRSQEKALPIIAANKEMVETVARIPSELEQLADKHWPGALTLILPVLGAELASGIIQNNEIAVRVSSHKVATELSHALGAPIVSTSANRSSEDVCYSVEDVQAQFKDQDETPDYYLDAGELDPEPVSTIVGLDQDGQMVIHRQGSIQI